MNDVEKPREASPRTPLRAERSDAALVAQYIHELAGRHAPARERAEEGHREPSVAA